MNLKGRKHYGADALLLLTAFIWGSGFAASHYALESGMKTTLILSLRFSIAALVLLVLFFKRIRAIDRAQLKSGALAGLFLYLAFYSQTVGLAFTTPSNNAFITATNVIMVPFLSWMVFKKKPRNKFFALACTTFLGVALLNYSPETGLSFSIGDSFTLLCALLFACHIAYLDVASKKVGALELTFIQMAVAALLSLLSFGLVDGFSLEGTDFAAGLPPVIYLGLFSTLLCFFFQTSAQKHTSSAKAAILLSTEALFGSLISVILVLEPFRLNMAVGGLVILSSIILSEVRLKKA